MFALCCSIEFKHFLDVVSLEIFVNNQYNKKKIEIEHNRNSMKKEEYGMKIILQKCMWIQHN